MENAHLIGAGLAIGFAGLGVALGQAKIGSKAVEVLGKNPNIGSALLMFTIIGIALTESAAIYAAFIVAKDIVAATSLGWMAALGAGLGVGLAGFGVGLGQGRIAEQAIESLNRNPEAQNNILVYMIVTIALVESAAIYATFIVAKDVISAASGS